MALTNDSLLSADEELLDSLTNMAPCYPSLDTDPKALDREQAISKPLCHVPIPRSVRSGKRGHVRKSISNSNSDGPPLKRSRPAIPRRQELINLRKAASGLNFALEQLRASSPPPLTGSPTAEEAQYVFSLLAQPASAWEVRASVELAALEKAQEENMRLKALVARSIQNAQQLERIIGRVLQSLSGGLSVQLPAWDIERIVGSLMNSLGDLYASVDGAMVAVDMATLPCPGRRRLTRPHLRRGVIFELLDRHPLPFEWLSTAAAVWVSIGERGLHYRHGRSLTVKAHEETDNTLVAAYTHTVKKLSASAVVRSCRAARKFIESGRAVIVSRTFMEPFLLGSGAPLGSNVLETRFIVVRPSEKHAKVVVETLVSVTRMEAQGKAARAFQSERDIEYAASCWSRTQTLDCQLIENLLIKTQLSK